MLSALRSSGPSFQTERPLPANPREGFACGVCRTDLHVVDGELPHPHIPIIPGHDIVGRVDALGDGVSGLTIGERVGIPWLAAVGFVE